MDRTAEGDQYLLFRSGSCIGALALADVWEVMRPLPVETIAGTPDCVLGIALIRGLPVPVIDAARLLNDAAISQPARFVSLKVGTRNACLAVDAVLDVRALLAAGTLHAAPALLADSSPALPLLGALDRELLVVLNTARIVPEAVWDSMQSMVSAA